MEALWIFVGFLTGAAIVFFTSQSRLKTADAELSNCKAKGEQAESARQKLEVELASVRSVANRADEAAAMLKDRDEEISKLKTANASHATAIEERGNALLEERQQFEDRRSDFLAQINQLQASLQSNLERIQALETERSSMKTTIEERERALEEERGQLNRLKEEFKAQFAEISINALKDNSEAFLANAKKVLALQSQEADATLAKREEEIKQMVKPIQESLKAVGEATRELESKREKAFGTIEEQLKQSIEHAAEVARQTSGLKDALKKPNVRGRWGEIQLRNCIELAGMEEHCDVEFQASSLSPEEERIRPDMIVRMPGGRKIAVDAKTPMDPFLQYIEATTDEDRNSALIRHARVVKTHIGKLITVDYMQKIAESPDFVIMFLPNESFLAMALEKEPSLMEDALTKKVLITTPGTLIGLLKVIRYGWSEQRMAENSLKIAEEGERLNTQITRFLEDFARLGSALKQASDAYEASSKRVETNITNTSRRLTLLGAKSKKVLTAKATKMLEAANLGQELAEVDDMELVPEEV